MSNVEGLRRQATATQKGEQSIGQLDGQYYRRDADSAPTSDNTYKIGTSGARLSEVHAVTFFGLATSAQYADVAEKYKSDMNLEPGDVVKIGGNEEITKTDSFANIDVFGIVSTNPAYLMNSEAEGHAVALLGRVPCKVIGKVKKGQRLIASSEAGVAEAVDSFEIGRSVSLLSIIGRALEDKDTIETGLVEVAIGKN